ncbi:hypothetical protein WM46_03205 [Citrobacter freundii complex sp. CFNIH2]|uniref:Acb2/Tad1 domain-containing protein n=1 Tax=Citrobacter freundii complex sp. CFNIH2 TaxID=2066049 RepID=UPI000C86B380|nr:hypothetical protein [Citrobacter freundii complex sp. CFNIH2]AUO63839.1 hypothetical protein WM46_03205 [Citrobacter freundii complex sp. CFNIH2]
MSEAKPQDGSTSDIERMNRLKGVSRHFCNLIDTEREVAAAEVVERGSQAETDRVEALRCLAIARTKMQEACMWACRAVSRPDADC